jgi:hypothetical protein
MTSVFGRREQQNTSIAARLATPHHETHERKREPSKFARLPLRLPPVHPHVGAERGAMGMGSVLTVQ